MAATAFSASSSERCCAILLNTSEMLREGTRSSAVSCRGAAKKAAFGPPAKYSSHPLESPAGKERLLAPGRAEGQGCGGAPRHGTPASPAGVLLVCWLRRGWTAGGQTVNDGVDFGLVLGFLTRLGKNNNKGWFEAHRADYEAAMDAFGSFVGRLITQIGRVEDLEGVGPKDCIMRIYRDVRFSKDKTPYKTHLGAEIVPGGRKSGRMGYFLRVSAGGGTMVAGGLYEPTPRQIARFREAVMRDAVPFKRIIASKPFKLHFGSLWGESLKTAPKGCPKDHPEIELLRRKQICAVESFADKEAASPRFERLALDSILAMKPFIDYLGALTS
jgi:uncharacterized protein (TIGR02453 family)